MQLPTTLPVRRAIAALLLGVASLLVGAGLRAQTDPGAAGNGPVVLRQPAPVPPSQRQRGLNAPPQAPARPGEFERYAQQLSGNPELHRLGAELVLDAGSDLDAADSSAVVPPDYVIDAGDEIVLSISGAVVADLRLFVDRAGRIAVPRVGPIQVAGVKYQDLTAAVDRQLRRVFKNFELTATLGQLHGLRVFVTGFAERPGAYTVGGLAGVSAVLFRAGGPSASGSYRNIELRRAGQVVARIDLYDLVVRGRRDAERIVQAADVIHVGPVGPQVAMFGSVNRPAVIELKAGETLTDVLQMAGGFSSVADRSRMAVERVDERSGGRIRQLAWPEAQAQALDAGDVVRVFSAVASALPQHRQNKRVQVEGEVQRPGEYVLPPGSSVRDLVRIAGGTTPNAFVYGTEFDRESVRQVQQQNFERLLRDLEVEVGKRSTATTRPGEEANALQVRNERLITRLRNAKPAGRIVLQMAPDSNELPDLELEDGDRLLIPPRPTSVGVFGSVFNPGSYLYSAQRTLDDYLNLAGNTTRGAEPDSVFVVRANGSVESMRQLSGFFGLRGDRFTSLPAYPGDTLFVPDEINRPSINQNLKDWAQILYQFGLGVAAVKSIVP